MTERAIDARFLGGRFVLATMVILLALCAAGVVGLSRLASQDERSEIGLTFSHLAEGYARLDIALNRAVNVGQEADRARLRTSYLSVLYHVDELRRAEPDRVEALRDGAAALGEFPIAPPDLAPLPIDRIVADRLPLFTPPHRHGLGALAMPEALHALWKGLSGGPSLEGEISRALMEIEPFAFGAGPLTLRERLDLAKLAGRDTGPVLDLLREGSILMLREHETAARSAVEALTGALAIGAIAALANLFALLLPLARKVHADRLALAQARDEARAANKAKTEFLATMSHELRTPLNGVLGMAAVLDAGELTARQRSCLGVIRSAAEALNGVIADILEYSRLDVGTLRLEREPFATERLAREPAAKLAPAARLKGLDMMVRVDPAAPAALFGDRERLDHVVTNFLSNAVKFTKTGKVVVDVSARRLETSRAMLRIEVRDTGQGVAPQDADRIFDLFTQADQSMTRVCGGVGLGLSICRTLAELMRGRIGVASHAGPGATFWFEVELDIADDAPCVQPDPAFADIRALIASPDPDRRRFLEELLGAWGMAAEASTDAGQIIHEPERYDLAVIDHVPPGLDVAATLFELWDTPGTARLAVAALTPTGMDADWAGVARIAKPASPESLRQGLFAALARTRAGLGDRAAASADDAAWREDPSLARRASA